MREQIINLIFEISKSRDAFNRLENELSVISKGSLSDNLISCGVLPEMFSHDGSEEKLWAKFSDILLSKALGFLGHDAQVLGARGNSADVWAKNEHYTLVGDAKTFRLSRTAKNQKDFKVNALDNWRGGNNYAILICPFLQYPSVKSQIYNQAISKNVTLLSYTHMHFLLDFRTNQNLQPIWETGKRLATIEGLNRQQAVIYWSEIDKVICEVLGKELSDLVEYKKAEIEQTKLIGAEGIRYWEQKIEQFQQLSKEEAIRLLIKSEKITSKIQTIQKAINIKINL
jgi:type II restriction enzyme